MAFYSFKVRSPDVLPIPGQLNMIDRGINVFSAVVEDVEDFVSQLQSMGVEVMEQHQLDNLERVDPRDVLIPGEERLLTAEELTALLGVSSGHGTSRS